MNCKYGMHHEGWPPGNEVLCAYCERDVLRAALHDAYDFISAPRCMTPDSVRYDVRGYNALTAKIRKALEEGKRHAHN
jgi:hypothetical protein